MKKEGSKKMKKMNYGGTMKKKTTMKSGGSMKKMGKGGKMGKKGC